MMMNQVRNIRNTPQKVRPPRLHAGMRAFLPIALVCLLACWTQAQDLREVAVKTDANNADALQCQQKGIATAPRKSIVLIGNPGSGKSTLLNTLLRKIHFKSGVRFVKNDTSYVNVYRVTPISVSLHS